MSDVVLNEAYVPPMGPRFSQLYLERGPATDDSPRLRNRVAAFFRSELYPYTSAATNGIETGIGTNHVFMGNAYSVAEYLKSCSAADFRDAITVIHRGMLKQYEREPYTSTQTAARKWREFCRDAFVEENVAYRVDDKCLVRPFVDEEFSRSAMAVLRGLTDRRLAAVRAEVENSMDRLGGKQPDPKAAVRAVFEALEIYAKLAITTCEVARLNRNVVTEHIIPAMASQPANRGPHAKSIGHLGDAFVDWLTACHIYRHGQGVIEPAPPPPELAVALVSQGLAYLRWLLDGLPLPADAPIA